VPLAARIAPAKRLSGRKTCEGFLEESASDGSACVPSIPKRYLRPELEICKNVFRCSVISSLAFEQHKQRAQEYKIDASAARHHGITCLRLRHTRDRPPHAAPLQAKRARWSADGCPSQRQAGDNTSDMFGHRLVCTFDVRVSTSSKGGFPDLLSKFSITR
jgi:hypothetical protein